MYVCLVFDEKSSKYSFTDRYNFTLFPVIAIAPSLNTSYKFLTKPVSKYVSTLKQKL